MHLRIESFNLNKCQVFSNIEAKMRVDIAKNAKFSGT
jgi:hypothetical protein